MLSSKVQMVQGNEITASTAVTTSGRSNAWQPALELFSRLGCAQLGQLMSILQLQQRQRRM